MKKKLDLDRCKLAAVLLLHLPPEHDATFGRLVVHHPFHNSSHLFIPNKDKTDLELFDCFEDDESYNKWKAFMEDNINKAKDLWDITVMFNTPYLMHYLLMISEFIYDEQLLSDLLKEIWTHTEFPNYNERNTLYQVKDLFSSCKNTIMDLEEQAYYDSLPDELIVYRGQYVPKGTKPKKPYNAMSWTPSEQSAYWFVRNRYQPNGILWAAKIKKEDTFCYLNIRGEEELILDWTKLYDIKQCDYD